MVYQAILAALRGRYMHDPANELLRIPLPETVWKVPIGLDSECSE
jgi:hypothetical protein